MAYNDPSFPSTPVSLNYNVADKTTYGRKTTDYNQRISDLDKILTELRTVQLPRAEEEMTAHRTIWQGAYDAAIALIATAAEDYCFPSGTTDATQPATFDLKDWSYLYAAGQLNRSIFFPYTETGGRFSGNPLDHPTCTFVYVPPPEELDPVTGQPTPPDPPLPPNGPELAQQYTMQFAAIMQEYNLMVRVLLRIAEGSIVKVHSILNAIDATELDRAHAVLTQSLSDQSGATAVATKTPAMWNDPTRYENEWQEYINPDDL